ncbi:uncharacterized protein LOC126591269 isoform X3 [Malus sylvestris]|uniref:uncharacterized protein LOC126591269 isoform X3 n=1 Tax=Malus sylvestris TaxID=3752 RepID=UPI0010A9DD10|nr:uncharacterized protein LOC103440511 [Malus domestica]XP_050112868.1 uncharacterized protein LOC126591269 isoform X3 [Malus sylvestris]XP_050112869.1 uncharacterized protein LOC126591269 isoform X3 [Malus sylvestris]XP_050112870.1 uncharacterized protein LOC126591269 isoform X3 [Malus sylvestris]XP_050112871.1 uncharacterized protein LOC126591269 isoform X3 [Malus sylvestris]XP_050112872.1 uncharacterized protein LOC126591269 isoform X3 [Malus sylvestris]XP_050112873.1 uncharacterized prot
MSKRSINALVNDDNNKKQTNSDNEYNVLVQCDHQPRKVCRTSYLENHENAVLSQIDTFLRTPYFKHQCSSSGSAVVQCDLKNANYDKVQHTASVEKIVQPSDRKGKKPINLLDNSDNMAEKTIDPQNYNLMNKGQAFFQKSRTGVLKDYVDFGDKNYKCSHCGAYFWLKESLKQMFARLNFKKEMPSKFLYDGRQKFWKPRKRKGSIGRIAYVHPASGYLHWNYCF